jgi:hypothetical protein
MMHLYGLTHADLIIALDQNQMVMVRRGERRDDHISAITYRPNLSLSPMGIMKMIAPTMRAATQPGRQCYIARDMREYPSKSRLLWHNASNICLNQVLSLKEHDNG